MNLDARNAKAQGQGQPRASHDVDEEEKREPALTRLRIVYRVLLTVKSVLAAANG